MEEKSIFLWEDQHPVSMTRKARATNNGIIIGLVYTPPEFRQQGYTSSCVASLSQLLLDEGYQFCSLYTDLANPTSNQIYQRIGYRPIQKSIMIQFQRENCRRSLSRH